MIYSGWSENRLEEGRRFVSFKIMGLRANAQNPWRSRMNHARAQRSLLLSRAPGIFRYLPPLPDPLVGPVLVPPIPDEPLPLEGPGEPIPPEFDPLFPPIEPLLPLSPVSIPEPAPPLLIPPGKLRFPPIPEPEFPLPVPGPGDVPCFPVPGRPVSIPLPALLPEPGRPVSIPLPALLPFPPLPLAPSATSSKSDVEPPSA